MKYVAPIVAVLVLIVGLGVLKFQQISTLINFGKTATKAGPPPDVVSSAPVEEQTWETLVPAVGSVAAVKGVTVSNDAPGVVIAILFESGAKVAAGQTLVQLDTSVERAQLASARARQRLADDNVKRTRVLVQGNALTASQLDNDEAVVRTSAADVGAVEAQISRKIVRAPFAGRLGIRLVNLGQYLNPGTPIASLEALESVFVDFTLPQDRLQDVPIGTPVRVRTEGSPEAGPRGSRPPAEGSPARGGAEGSPAGTDGAAFDGTIVAVDSAVDAVTRSIKVRASVPNRGEALRPGMFVRVSVVLPKKKPVLTVSATALLHAPYGDSVFVLEDTPDAAPAPDGRPVKTARQQFVRVTESRGDFVAVEGGVKKGDVIVTAGAFKLRNGGHVVVNNAVMLDPSVTPQPENR